MDAYKSLEPGLFSPDPHQAPLHKMIAAQGRVEAKLMLRHGEQLLLNLLIPAALLVAAALVPVFGEPNLNILVPMVFAVAASSAGFTGQAIALAFDRRYGALKRVGASGVPPRAIIAGKILGVFAMVLVQIAILGSLAFALGWRLSLIGAMTGVAALFAGVAVFTALGLLLGGTLAPEIVLALANLLWVVMMAVLGWVAWSSQITDAGWWNAIPTVALAGALEEALQGRWNELAWLSLAAWAVAGIGASARWFRFDA